MQVVKIHNSQVLAKEDKAFGGLRPIHYSSPKVAKRKIDQLNAQGYRASVYQPNRLMYIKVEK